MSDQNYRDKNQGGGSNYQKSKYKQKGPTKGEEGSSSQAQQKQYVAKKPQKPQPTEIEEEKKLVEQQSKISQPSNLTAEEKFNAVFGTGNIQKVQEQQNGQRKRYNKEWLLNKYQPVDEIDMNIFSKDKLSFLEIISMSPVKPETIEPSEQMLPQSQMQAEKRKPRVEKGKYARDFRRGVEHIEEENEQDPEWVDFDPTKESKAFVGRIMSDEQKIRDQVQKEKERGFTAGGQRIRRESEDEFEKLIRRKKEEEEQELRKKINALDTELQKKAETLAEDFEMSGSKYSEIDLIVEKKISYQNKRDDILNEKELDDLFSSLQEQEQQKKQHEQIEEVKEEEEVEKITPITKEQLPKQLQQEIQSMTIQQQQQLEAQKLVQQYKPQFSAIQNISNLFQNFPVVASEKHRIKLRDIQNTEYDQQGGDLFKQLMSSINPFSQYVVEEIKEVEKIQAKPWELDQAIFQNMQGQANPNIQHVSTHEMFTIYKYSNDPFLKVKSSTYTNDEFVQIKDLFPKTNLLQVSPLDAKLSQFGIRPGMKPVQINKDMLQFVGPAQGQEQAKDSQQEVPQQIPPTQQQEEYTLEDEQMEEEKVETYYSGNELASMESQLKSMLGFNPR